MTKMYTISYIKFKKNNMSKEIQSIFVDFYAYKTQLRKINKRLRKYN